MRRYLASQATAAVNLAAATLMSLVAVRLAVNRFQADGDARVDVACLGCGSPMRPDTTTALGVLVCTNCQRATTEYEATLEGLILPLDLEAAANKTQADGRKAFIKEEGALPKSIRAHEARVAEKWAAYEEAYRAANPPKDKQAKANGADSKDKEEKLE